MSGAPIASDHIYGEANAGRMGARLMAVVAEGDRGRVYLAPTPEMEAIALTAQPEWKPEVAMPENPRWFSPPLYGLKTYGDLFTARQLVALTTFSDLVQEARERVKCDVLGARASRPRNTWHRTHLPHFEADETPQHITFRLADSLPAELIERWRQELERIPAEQRSAEMRKRYESCLDQGHGRCVLRDPQIAEMVANALRYFDGTKYHLHEWVVMPNHVHALITPRYGNSLSSIVHSWKSFTAKAGNRILGTEGAFWQEDYFDRVVRDARHWDAVVAYVRENPVKAGLSATAETYPFGSAWVGERIEGGTPSLHDKPLAEGGTGATAYAEAVGVYLAFAISRSADRGSSVCSWDNSPKMEALRNTFGRQAIPMVWDFAEGNPFSESSGNWMNNVEWGAKAVANMLGNAGGSAIQADATKQETSSGKVVSCDPPYYDNIGYADLSDFFYVWLRRTLKPTLPELFATLAVPKAEELVATPYRHGSKAKAETFFLDGMRQAMHRLAEQAHPAFPVTIYYAFKQAETDGADGTTNTGWDAFLAAVIEAGFAISGTWPMRTELRGCENIPPNPLASLARPV